MLCIKWCFIFLSSLDMLIIILILGFFIVVIGLFNSVGSFWHVLYAWMFEFDMLIQGSIRTIGFVAIRNRASKKPLDFSCISAISSHWLLKSILKLSFLGQVFVVMMASCVIIRWTIDLWVIIRDIIMAFDLNIGTTELLLYLFDSSQ